MQSVSVPAGPHIVDRTPLVQALVRRQPRLTLIHAAAGYGKSTLLKQWAAAEAQAGHDVIWVTLSAQDTEAAQFISTLADAFLQKDKTLKTTVNAIVRGSPPMTSEQSLKVLCQAISDWHRPLMLILDDFNTAQSSKIERLTDTLLRLLPPHVYLVIASRKRPRLSLAALMAEGKLLEVTADDLRLSLDEAREVFGKVLAEQALRDLLDKTRGWGIALQMAKVLVEKSDDPAAFVRHFAGTTQDISDYLTNQVFSSLSPECQNFLVDTSFLEQINGNLADYICGHSDSARFLEELKSIQAFFIPHEMGGQTWYRHHPMFNEFLWSRFAAKEPEAVKRLYYRAAEWYWRHENVVDAIRYARKSDDLALVVQIFQSFGGATIGLSQGVGKLQKILSLLPNKWIHQTPCLLIARALALAKEGRLQECYECITSAKARFHESEDAATRRDILFSSLLVKAYADEAVSAQDLTDMEHLLAEIPLSDYWFRGWVNNVLCMLNFRHGNLAAAHSAAVRAMANYRDADALYTQFFIHVHLGFVEYIRGAFMEAFRFYRLAERVAVREFSSDPAMLALARLMMANLYFERNYLERAEQLLRDTLPMVETYEGWTEIFISGYLTSASVAYQRKGLAAAFRILDRAEETAHARGLPRVLWRAVCKKVELLTLDGNIELAASLADANNITELLNLSDNVPGESLPCPLSWDLRQAVATTLARLAIYSGRPDKAFSILESVAINSEAMDRPAYTLKKQLLLAMAEMDMDQSNAAVARLAKLMAHPMRRSFRRLFLGEGDRVSQLFRIAHDLAAQNNGDAALCLQRLSTDKTLNSIYGKTHGAYYLTSREQEILQQIDMGRSSKHIANRLNLTERTIKFHLQNIYMKFGVNSRTKALHIARKHRLL
ncbi:MAG: AAA family ATPase [Sphingomonadales bacterium]|nr:AAA family ATPase [Sphingomonadales bacterium]